MRAVWLSCIGLCELEEVVGGADHRPFGRHFLDAAHEELPEASCRLDLTEHRLDDLLAQAVAAAPTAAFEPALHRLGQRAERLAFGLVRMRRIMSATPFDPFQVHQPSGDELVQLGARWMELTRQIDDPAL